MSTTISKKNHQLASVRLPGDGIAIVFCGGFKSNMQGNKAQSLEQLCRTNRWGYCRFDYQGHGQSAGEFEDGNISQWLENTLSIIDSINNEKLILVGSSMGAWIAQLACIQRPERVAALLLLASATDFTRDLILASLSDEQLNTLENDGRLLIPSEYDDGSPYPITKQLLQDGSKHILLEKPIPINCPVRLIHGSQDIDVPWQTSMRTLEKLESSDAQLTLIKDADHRLSNPTELAIIERTLRTLYQEVSI